MMSYEFDRQENERLREENAALREALEESRAREDAAIWSLATPLERERNAHDPRAWIAAKRETIERVLSERNPGVNAPVGR